MVSVIDRSFNLNIRLMEILCWYRPINTSYLFLVRGYTLYFGLIVVSTILTITDLVFEKKYTPIQFIFIASSVCFWFKILPFLANGIRIRKCINYFGDSYFTPQNDVEMKISEDSVAVCRRNSLIYIIGVIITLFYFVIPPALSKALPIQIWLPYDLTSGALTFYPTLLYFSAVSFCDGFAAGLIDPLIGGLACHATNQLKILKCRLQNSHIIESSNFTKNEKFNKLSVYYNLRDCVIYHKAILKFVDEFEQCFSMSIFSQFAGTTFSLCFCCVGFTKVSINSTDSLLFTLAFLVLIFQVFFYCYYGTLLFEENETLASDLYMSPWYEYDVENRKLLITIMERSKRPMIVTAGKILELTLQTFSAMVKSSYSMVSLFKNYQ